MNHTPRYKNASYAGESIRLQNSHFRFDFHKRRTGWGWGEIFNGAGELIAVLDHLGEILLSDQEIPMRMEAVDVVQTEGDFGERLTIQVRSAVVREKLNGTSFSNWIHYPLDSSILTGEVILTLDKKLPVLAISQRFRAQGNLSARYIRGPWLKVGQDSFGAAKDDAIFPGIDWLIGDEWSSGTDWFKDPWAKRWMPHPNKVTAPVMAVSHQQTGIGLAWNPNSSVTGWFNYRRCSPQPVFASPNFLDRRNNHILGLMTPDAVLESQENQVCVEVPLELHPEQQINFDAEIFLVEGSSLEVLTDWTKRHGMPITSATQLELHQALDSIVTAYTGPLWHEGLGFGTAQTPDGIKPCPPRFAAEYLDRFPDAPLAESLKAKIEWCREQTDSLEDSLQDTKLKHIEELLSFQSLDGSFPFDPDGRHYRKDDFVVAREFVEPMGLAGDTALDITILPAIEMLQFANDSGNIRLRDAACKALDHCLQFYRPEGGDFWETPLHAPNLLAAGHAANAYILGYRAVGDERYKDKAIFWIRCLLPFTHLWEPAGKPMLYNTKPCLCSSDWYFANWVRDHVQWEVLETFAQAISLGIKWAEIDTELDWSSYQRAVTVAALRWMVDSKIDNWLPHNIPGSLELFRNGAFDGCFADTHNSVTGNYGGMVIPPDVIAINLLALLNE